MAGGRTALVPRVRLAHPHHRHNRASLCGGPERTEVSPERLGDNVRLDAPELATLRHVTSNLLEVYVVEADAAPPGAGHVVACVIAASDVGVVPENAAERGATGLGHVPVNHGPTLSSVCRGVLRDGHGVRVDSASHSKFWRRVTAVCLSERP